MLTKMLLSLTHTFLMRYRSISPRFFLKKLLAFWKKKMYINYVKYLWSNKYSSCINYILNNFFLTGKIIITLLFFLGQVV